MCDLVIIGAGPAGMASAALAADCGLDVALIDEQPRAGGQIYRDVDRAGKLRGDILGSDYLAGAELTRALAHPRIRHIAGAIVWSLGDDGTVSYSQAGRSGSVQGQRLLLATGALERPMPLPGWTLPGVMTAGAAQILLKQSGVIATKPVIVGCGPLLYLIGAQLVRAGTPPLAMVETQGLRDMARGLRHIGGAVRGWDHMLKGLSMMREIRAAGVPRYTGAGDIAIEGTLGAEAVSFISGGRHHRIECRTVLLHHGVVPNIQATRSVGIDHEWDETQYCFRPVTDEWGRSSSRAIFVAGDGAGIGGAKAAALLGRLSALAVATDIGALASTERDRRATPIRKALSRELAARPFLDEVYRPFQGALSPGDDTIICRCEETTAGDIRHFAKLGCLGPNQAKAFGRAGMGPCQGRYCGLTVNAILAQANHRSEAETGYYRIRPPIKPVTLGEIAGTHQDTENPMPAGQQND